MLERRLSEEGRGGACRAEGPPGPGQREHARRSEQRRVNKQIRLQQRDCAEQCLEMRWHRDL